VFTSLSGYNSTLVQARLAADINSASPPTFCSTNSTPSGLLNFPHWVFGQGQAWQSPQCVGYLQRSEFTATAPSYASVHTNFVQKGYLRSCVAACYDGGDYEVGATGAAQPGCAANSSLMAPEFPAQGDGASNGTTATFFTFPNNCSTSVTSYALGYVYLAENVSVSFTPVYSTSWGASGLYDSLQLLDGKGAAVGDPVYGGTLTFATLSDALAAAGVTLESQNLESGGEGLWNGTPAFATNSETDWPSYRTTGLVLSVDIRTSNFRSSSPVNFNVTGRVTVRVAAPGLWGIGPVSVDYYGANYASPPSPLFGVPGYMQRPHDYDSAWVERQWQGVQLHFGATGVVGHPDAFTALSSILSSFLIVLLAVAITDAIGTAVSEEFQHEKFEDDGERRALDGFFEKEADHGVPFNFEDLKLRQANGELSEECYESAIFRLEKEIDELRTGGEKVRDAAALIAEELDMGQLLSDKAAKPKKVCMLVSGYTEVSKEFPDGKFHRTNDVIDLFPGENVIGRGIGAIKTATVSRKQVCISIDAANPERAFISSMRKENAPSYPVIKRGDATGPMAIWKKISIKGQSIKLGDTIGLQQKIGAHNEPMTATCEYQFLPLSEVTVVEGNWLKNLFNFS